MAVGTVQGNRRGMPVAVKEAALQRVEVVFQRRESLLALKWKDNDKVASGERVLLWRDHCIMQIWIYSSACSPMNLINFGHVYLL